MSQKISQSAKALSLIGDELIPIVKAGSNMRTDPNQLKDFLQIQNITASNNTIIYKDSSGNYVGNSKMTFINDRLFVKDQIKFGALDEANIFIGFEAGKLTVKSGGAIGTGTERGVKNVVIGDKSLTFNVDGIDNTVVGYESLVKCTSSQNTALGMHCLVELISGEQNTGIGVNCLKKLVIGSENVAIGSNAGLEIRTSSNVIVGSTALYNNNSGGQLTAVGYGAMRASISSTESTAFGYGALRFVVSGNYNTAFGHSALYNTLGDDSVGIGYKAGFTNQSGNCVYLGNSAGFWETESNKLFIDNHHRGSEANGRDKSLIYGKFDSDPLNQFIVINGNLTTIGVKKRGWQSGDPLSVFTTDGGTVLVSSLGSGSAPDLNGSVFKSTSNNPFFLKLSNNSTDVATYPKVNEILNLTAKVNGLVGGIPSVIDDTILRIEVNHKDAFDSSLEVYLPNGNQGNTTKVFSVDKNSGIYQRGVNSLDDINSWIMSQWNSSTGVQQSARTYYLSWLSNNLVTAVFREDLNPVSGQPNIKTKRLMFASPIVADSQTLEEIKVKLFDLGLLNEDIFFSPDSNSIPDNSEQLIEQWIKGELYRVDLTPPYNTSPTKGAFKKINEPDVFSTIELPDFIQRLLDDPFKPLKKVIYCPSIRSNICFYDIGSTEFSFSFGDGTPEAKGSDLNSFFQVMGKGYLPGDNNTNADTLRKRAYKRLKLGSIVGVSDADVVGSGFSIKGVYVCKFDNAGSNRLMINF